MEQLAQDLRYAARSCRVIGVVKSVRQVGLDQGVLPEFYVSAAQVSEGMGSLAFVVSAKGDLNALASEVRATVHEVAPTQPVYALGTMSHVVEISVAVRRLLLELLLGFALLALVLAAAGVYGVMSYGVTQRRSEIGIRIALGAKFGDGTRMILRDVALIAMSGIVAGIASSLLLTRALASVLYGIGVYDPLSFAAAPSVIPMS